MVSRGVIITATSGALVLFGVLMAAFAFVDFFMSGGQLDEFTFVWILATGIACALIGGIIDPQGTIDENAKKWEDHQKYLALQEEHEYTIEVTDDVIQKGLEESDYATKN